VSERQEVRAMEAMLISARGQANVPVDSFLLLAAAAEPARQQEREAQQERGRGAGAQPNGQSRGGTSERQEVCILKSTYSSTIGTYSSTRILQYVYKDVNAAVSELRSAFVGVSEREKR
jgi:hypothetical protein